ncbi:MAG: protoheme IX farnesyltransferase [Lentimicrobium sp.]|jgi:protoheme IX farnesyltransferase|nr:protoheme IX farnesyltransferase [Lentimicrobium sp.]
MTFLRKAYFKALGKLGKYRIAIPVALTALTGYVLYARAFQWGMFLPGFGVFFLALASSALNQVQERHIDKLMPRTKSRPLPSGALSLEEAWIWIIIWSAAGVLLLWYFSGIVALLLGLLTYLWYNGIYTPLKQKTALAVVPGSVVGALPPVIGWVAAGGSVLNPTAVALFFFFFIGQVPHFWLLLLQFGKQYELTGVKSLTTHLSNNQIRRITFIWIVATSVSAFMLPGFYRFENIWVVYTLWSLSVIMVAYFARLIMPSNEDVKFNSSFLLINLYYLLVMILLSIESLI